MNGTDGGAPAGAVPWTTRVDSWLRRSSLARMLPWIRERSPWLHHVLLAGRDWLLPYASPIGLDRYQSRAVDRFLAYARPHAADILLEVGSDLEARCLREIRRRGFPRVLGTNLVVAEGGVDATAVAERPPFLQADVRRLPFEDGSIAAILSVTAFEHIHELGKGLEEMHRVLRPGGIVYSDFGPLWSCSVGHHVYAKADGLEARFFKPGKNPVPHFAHLLLEEEELGERLREVGWVTEGLAQAILEWIYHGPGVNRLFYEDYLRHFERSPFVVRSLEPVREHVPRAVQEALERRYPGYTRFDVRMAEVVLERTE